MLHSLPPTGRWALTGGQTLLPTGMETDAVLHIEDGVIAEVSSEALGRPTLDAAGRLVLPGMIDLHGDAFERQLMPRPGVHFDTRLALADTDRQLVANGISTAFHGVTHSWEPGLRSGEALVAFMEALDAARPHLVCDTRLHLRQETFHLDGEADALRWLAEGRVHLLAFNDHLHDIFKKLDSATASMTVLQRTGLSLEALKALAGQVAAREADVPASIARLAAAARAAGVPMASHDDTSTEQRQGYQALACTISEFPKTLETAQAARAAGSPVIFGSPNVVRGGSHQKNAVSAGDMVARGLCSVLTSDYYYPAMLQAPFRLAADGACSFEAAWSLVSSHAADAALLPDRGRLAVGQRADVLLVEPPGEMPARVVLHLIRGNVAYATRGAPSLRPAAHFPTRAAASTAEPAWVEP